MAARGIIVVTALIAALTVASSASGAGTYGVVVESETTHGNRKLHQDFDVRRTSIDYHVVARDPDGLYPYCVTVRLERRTKRHGWRPLAKSIETFRHECFKTPSDGESRRDSFAAWDTFIYPRGRTAERFRQGELRVHGFTDLGGELILRR
jgi:hypothetical protein